jgi:hypothetical protein
MDKGIWVYVRRGFLDAKGPLITVVTLVGMVFMWLFAKDTGIPAWLVLGLVLVLGSVAWTLWAALGRCRDAEVRLPAVVAVRSSESRSRGKQTLIVLRESQLFGYGTLVSIYKRLEDFEDYIGYGVVVNVQSDGLVQVAVRGKLKVSGEFLGALQRCEAGELRKLLVRPSIQQEIWAELGGDLDDVSE